MRGFLERNTDGSGYHISRIRTLLPELYLIKPNIVTDPAISIKWLDGAAGRETLRLMGNTETDNKPSTLQEEERRVRKFITSTEQRTWSLRYQDETIGAVWVYLKASEYLKAPSVHIMIGDPGVRGKGVGQAAILALIELLEQEGEHQELYSRYLVENTGSAKLLTKAGFTNDSAAYKDSDDLTFQNVKRQLLLSPYT